MSRGPRRNFLISEVRPTIDTNAYGDGDRLGSIHTISGIVRADESTYHGALLRNVTIIDLTPQSAAMDIYFFDTLPTVASADNDAINIADAELNDKCIGFVQVVANDYTTVLSGGNAVAFKEVGNLVLKAINGSVSAYAVVVSRGTPTYGAATDLIFKYALEIS